MERENKQKQLDLLDEKRKYILNQLSSIGAVDYKKAVQFREALKKIKDEIASINEDLDQMETQSSIKFLGGKRQKSKTVIEPPKNPIFPWKK